MVLTMISSSVDHSCASGISSPPVKVNGHVEPSNTSQAPNVAQQAIGHGQCHDYKINNGHHELKDQASKVSNSHTESCANGHANGIVETHTSRCANGHMNNLDNGLNTERIQEGEKTMDDGSKDKSSPNVRSRRPPSANKDKYRHIVAVHKKARSSCLSHDSPASPSFIGFRNLMVLVLSTCFHVFLPAGRKGKLMGCLLVVMNLRLVIENFMKVY